MARPTVSSLSLLGIVKHVAWTECDGQAQAAIPDLQ